MDKISIAKWKLLPNDSPLGEPEGTLFKIYSGHNSAPKSFDVSSGAMNPDAEEQMLSWKYTI